MLRLHRERGPVPCQVPLSVSSLHHSLYLVYVQHAFTQTEARSLRFSLSPVVSPASWLLASSRSFVRPSARSRRMPTPTLPARDGMRPRGRQTDRQTDIQTDRGLKENRPIGRSRRRRRRTPTVETDWGKNGKCWICTAMDRDETQRVSGRRKTEAGGGENEKRKEDLCRQTYRRTDETEEKVEDRREKTGELVRRRRRRRALPAE